MREAVEKCGGGDLYYYLKLDTLKIDAKEVVGKFLEALPVINFDEGRRVSYRSFLQFDEMVHPFLNILNTHLLADQHYQAALIEYLKGQVANQQLKKNLISLYGYLNRFYKDKLQNFPLFSIFFKTLLEVLAEEDEEFRSITWFEGEMTAKSNAVLVPADTDQTSQMVEKIRVDLVGAGVGEGSYQRNVPETEVLKPVDSASISPGSVQGLNWFRGFVNTCRPARLAVTGFTLASLFLVVRAVGVSIPGGSDITLQAAMDRQKSIIKMPVQGLSAVPTPGPVVEKPLDISSPLTLQGITAEGLKAQIDQLSELKDKKRGLRPGESRDIKFDVINEGGQQIQIFISVYRKTGDDQNIFDYVLLVDGKDKEKWALASDETPIKTLNAFLAKRVKELKDA
ncbi:MAG: hypothetical protein UR28_C0032G0010 [Candidatus Peregrinibacteria bacterium GW2011_GWF2_33_10]|nr:MAG: hypothetical protein UR28_C0032G0010 [Candidatus Peregrinibacteria bacterium GW2011_GWF2_33_10]OGJ45187.1 MAG: hypothetical protein A2272_06920 [Candidatus Peregrinibacteria bacterium RIFOXYA12_FULL_33_12]